MEPLKGKHPKNSALHFACLTGDIKRVKNILSLGGNVNARGMLNRTLVMLAAWKRQREVLEFLLRQGADVGLVDGRDDSILHLACVGGDGYIVNLILCKYITLVNIDGKGNYGKTPVMEAAYAGHLNVLQQLRSKGADMSLVDDGGDNVLHWACVGGHIEVVSYVLSIICFDMNCRGVCERTPVMAAAVHGHEQVFHVIVSKGGDMTLTDAKCRNILHLACRGGNVELVKRVLSKNIFDINSKDHFGNTALMEASVQRHREMVNLLQGKGAKSL
ncbi:serine/threonine-protein phosphatase 6 regulatory ankyrin repeat subunit C-like [Haliotis asinina]|uniref:serine/threonine-protein phosphatase 6 regulatory ankyrin repeat subunit C-like n=1 Tax=Haliotis asinina TaxID=109174 RepID=UPI003531B30B